MDSAADRPALPASAEIANLEHELGVLRERHSSLLVNERRMVMAFTYGAWATVAVALCLIIYSLTIGEVFGAVIVAIIILILGVGWISEYKGWDFEVGDFRHPFRSDKQFLERAIAVREQRLKELKVQP
jgi:hypothetical protein